MRSVHSGEATSHLNYAQRLLSRAREEIGALAAFAVARALANAASCLVLKQPTLSRLRPGSFRVACHGRFFEALRCTPT